MDKLLAFDLEIAKIIPEGESDWSKFWPLGICCAATLTTAQSPDCEREWYGWNYGPQMNETECQVLARYLARKAAEGYRIVTWNGLGFDFKVLAAESGLHDLCRELALSHLDLMFHFFCANGYPVGLDRVAKGLGLTGKPPDMDGARAPQMWAAGEHQKVLDYCMGDARMTLDVARLAPEQGELRWTSRQGKPCAWPVTRWLTVSDARRLPEPDVSWMKEPWKREKFLEW